VQGWAWPFGGEGAGTAGFVVELFCTVCSTCAGVELNRLEGKGVRYSWSCTVTILLCVPAEVIQTFCRRMVRYRWLCTVTFCTVYFAGEILTVWRRGVRYSWPSRYLVLPSWTSSQLSRRGGIKCTVHTVCLDNQNITYFPYELSDNFDAKNLSLFLLYNSLIYIYNEAFS
jgi:hypothetical protein